MNGQNQVQFPAGISVDKIMSLVDTINSLDRSINVSISVRDFKMRELNSYGLTIVNGAVTQKREPVREVNLQAPTVVPQVSVNSPSEPPKPAMPSATQTVPGDAAVLKTIDNQST